ncbi:Ger(x)C family spore germination protein [Paenibacillus taichungensis]|uniref:Ger(x)C family spore germination protein n=1 Tax=Paenibacillus taichungensis TaxID=484184 RepID=UPI0039A20580
MKPSFIIIILVVICGSLISGCWNRRELNELAVAVAIGVDKKDEKINLSHQILNVGAISEKGSSYATVNVFQETGESINVMSRKTTTKSTRKLYVGQLQMLVLGEEFAKEGVAKVLDNISRDHEFRSDFFVIIARKGEARDILKVFTPLEKTPATKLKNSLEVSSEVWGETSAVEFRDLTSNVISKGREAVLTGITLEGSTKEGNGISNVSKIFPSARLMYSGLGVFKKDKLIGWLNAKESIGYNFTQGKIKSTVLAQPCPKSSGVVTVELLRTKSKMNAFIEEGKPSVNIFVEADGVVTDAECSLDFTNPSTITQIEDASEAQINNYISSVVRKMQNRYNSDIFGFGELFERKHPRYWKKNKSEWDDVFPTIQVKIHPKVHVRQMYRTTKSIDERIKEQ